MFLYANKNRRHPKRFPILGLAACIAISLTLLTSGPLRAQPPSNYQLQQDWLISPESFPARVIVSDDRREVSLDNGLIRRTFRAEGESFSTIAFDQLATGTSLIRAIRPDAQLTIDGVQFQLGGMLGQPNHAFLRPQDLQQMHFDPASMRLIGFETTETQPRFEWKQVRHRAPDADWPPPGVGLRFDFQPTLAQQKSFPIRVSLHYEIYDGLPLISKWITVTNTGQQTITIDSFTAETLALVEPSNPVETRDGVPLEKPQSLHVETDMAFSAFKSEAANRHAVHYRTDPEYTTQVNYLRKQPCLLVVEPTYGPSQDIAADETFETFRVFELAMDSSDRERRGLAQRKMYRTIAPWVTENPLMHHMRNADPADVRTAIDQAAEVGFEMVILSFGSGFNAENDSPEYLAQWKQLADHAQRQGIDLGCYSLYSSRKIGDGNDIVPPDGQSLIHGNCPAITSPWGQTYLSRLHRLFETTGFRVFEHDGPYPGDVDTIARPPLQKGTQDSRWVHWRTWTQFYQFLRARGVYLNAPDFYYLAGSNKCGMGYREVNWSLPRSQQLLHTRQNIFDGTWEKTPSMGWMFVPLSEYHGGGAAATIEPLDQHIEHYRLMIVSNLALGVQACYRGPRLFDTDRVKSMVKEQVEWYKQYRDILESDMVHLRRADGRRLDGMLHVNARLKNRAMLCVFNPTDQPKTETWTIPLYYAGLSENARITRPDGTSDTVTLDPFCRTQVELKVPANDFVWLLVTAD